jgi:hypothetical protein
MIHFGLSTKTDFPILTDRKGDYFSWGEGERVEHKGGKIC